MSYNLPPGTPTGEHDAGQLAPVWCACRPPIKWIPTPEGYRPEQVDAAHPDVPCRPAAAIPCGPVVPYDPADYPNSGPAAVRDVLGEQP